MKELILVTGGARGGKSAFSEKLILDEGLRCTYIATSPRCDDEMNDRIRRHQERRIGWNWKTIEEEIDLAGAVSAAAADGAEAILIDCLTLWINNLLYRNPAFGEDEMRAECEKLLSAIGRFPGKAVLVINEVGLGMVPETPLCRSFRDCSGRCAQIIAAQADQCYLCVCGIPLKIKG